MSLRLRIHTQARTAFYPDEEDALGQRLMSLLQERLRPIEGARRLPRPSLVLVFPDVVRVVDVLPLLRMGRQAHRAIAAFASLEGLEAMALVGVLDRRRHGGPVERVAGTFLEWPDGRWWFSVQNLDATGNLADKPEVLHVMRHPKPRGLGSWFSRARFEELKVQLESLEDEMVH
jgi:hypothetical protein